MLSCFIFFRTRGPVLERFNPVATSYIFSRARGQCPYTYRSPLGGLLPSCVSPLTALGEHGDSTPTLLLAFELAIVSCTAGG